MTGDVRVPMPDEMRNRAVQLGPPPEQVTRFRPASWERPLAFVPEACTLLRDAVLTGELEGSDEDRTVSRSVLEAHLTTLDLRVTEEVLSAFTLVVAWGSGTTNTRSLRYTPLALADPLRAAHSLSEAVERLRSGDLLGAYRRFRLPGIGQSNATRWFALAGRRPDHDWQPLILDARVRAGLEVIGVSLYAVAGGRRSRADGYAAYVRLLHTWADDVRAENPSCRAETMEWLLSQYGRASWETA
jgi:hypothetical protein